MTSSDSPGTDFVESGHQQNKDYVCMNAYDCILVVFIYVCVEYLLIISISCSINPIACCEKNVTVPKHSVGSFPQPPGLAGAHLTKGRVAALSWFYWEKPMPKPMGFRWFSHPV